MPGWWSGSGCPRCCDACRRTSRTSWKTAPYYDRINGTIINWVGQGQGLDLDSSNGSWRGGRLWGGDGRKVWMQAQNLNGPGGGPC